MDKFELMFGIARTAANYYPPRNSALDHEGPARGLSILAARRVIEAGELPDVVFHNDGGIVFIFVNIDARLLCDNDNCIFLMRPGAEPRLIANDELPQLLADLRAEQGPIDASV